MLRKLFIDHPTEVGESYGEHFAVATGFGISLLAGGLACLVHAIVPALCKTTGSGIVRNLYRRMDGRRAPVEPRELLDADALEWVI